MLIDPGAAVAVFDQRIAGCENPRHRAMLEVAREHMVAELIDLDLERTMATMVHDPIYRFYGTAGMQDFEGQDATREVYEQLFRSGPDQASMTIDALIVDDDHIVQLGTMNMSGECVRAIHPAIAAALDDAKPYVLRKRACVVFPFRDGKMAGEIFYMDGPWTAQDVHYLTDSSR